MKDFKKIASDFIYSLSRHKKLLIAIKGSPDPDAIAASYAVKSICDYLNLESDIICFQHISLQQNSDMVKYLDIPIVFIDKIEHVKYYDGFIITDHQSAAYMGISGLIPCVAHIDHHEKTNDGVNPEFRLIMNDAGSTSTIIAKIISDSDILLDEKIMRLVATALIIGIQTDTDKYDHAGELDFEALNFLSKYSDTGLLSKISNVSISDYTFEIFEKAINNKIIYKDWMITGVGFIDEEHRDSIAITADYLLKNKDASTVIVFAAITHNNKNLIIDASFRSIKENLNLNDIIKEITTHGGARKYKGAYQINIDYFVNCPDRELLWKVIEITTYEVLKKQRDGVYIIELKSMYKKFKQRVLKYFFKNQLK